MIDQKFLPVKLTLFCWFAGGFGVHAFLPVFLKHQGLSISHFSVITGVGVGIQFFGGIISAFLADKIGRLKPFWFFFLALFSVACVGLSTLPRIQECNAENAYFLCHDKQMLQLNATACVITPKISQEILCSNVTTYEKNTFDQNGISRLSVTMFLNFEAILKMENENLSGIYSSFSNCTNFPLKNCSNGSSDNCTSLYINCAVKLMDCNKDAKFWIVIYGVFVTLYSFTRTNVFRFTDIIVSDLTFETNSDFGRQRIFSILGVMVGPPFIGIILNTINGSSDNEKSYICVFVCAIIFSVLAAISMCLVNPKFHRPASKMWKKSSKLLKDLDIILFFVLVVTMGCVIGFQFTYRNWYLKELGASDLLTGIVSGSTSLYGIPFLYNSKWCINKIGVRNVFILGLLGHAIYSFGFSIMGEPWIAVLLESTTILSYHLFWVAVMQYSDEMAPEGLVAVMKALAGSLHFNIGKLGSSLIAGYVMKHFGGRVALIVLGCIALAYLIIYGSYLTVHHLRQKKKAIPSESIPVNEITEQDPVSE